MSMFLIVAEQCLHTVKDFSASHAALQARRWEHMRGDTARTADPD